MRTVHWCSLAKKLTMYSSSQLVFRAKAILLVVFSYAQCQAHPGVPTDPAVAVSAV